MREYTEVVKSNLLSSNDKYKVENNLINYEPAADTRDCNMRYMDTNSTLTNCCIVTLVLIAIPVVIGGIYIGVSMGGFITSPAYCNYTTKQLAALVSTGAMTSEVAIECVCAQTSLTTNLSR